MTFGVMCWDFVVIAVKTEWMWYWISVFYDHELYESWYMNMGTLVYLTNIIWAKALLNAICTKINERLFTENTENKILSIKMKH